MTQAPATPAATQAQTISQEQQSDLAKMIPESNTITVGGKEITIKTMKVKQLSATIRAIQPFVDTLRQGGADMSEVVFNNTEAVVDLVVILTEEPREFIEGLGVDELIVIFTKLVEANLDFFTQKVLPLLSGAMVRLTSGLPTGTKPESMSGQAFSKT